MVSPNYTSAVWRRIFFIKGEGSSSQIMDALRETDKYGALLQIGPSDFRERCATLKKEIDDRRTSNVSNRSQPGRGWQRPPIREDLDRSCSRENCRVADHRPHPFGDGPPVEGRYAIHTGRWRKPGARSTGKISAEPPVKLAGPWYLRNSRRAIWFLCTSSGPSASRSTRAVA